MSVSFTVSAVWDTGSTFTAISRPLAEQYGLWSSRSATASGLGGFNNGSWLNLPFRLSNGKLFTSQRTMSCDLPAGIDFVIGMDIIRTGDFCISNSGGKTLFSFITPSLPAPVNLAEMAV
jgi:hypothetical protein